MPNGEVHFYRPSDRRLDRRFDIALDSNQAMGVSVQDLSRGYWKVLIDWTEGGKDYSWEEQLVF